MAGSVAVEVTGMGRTYVCFVLSIFLSVDVLYDRCVCIFFFLTIKKKEYVTKSRRSHY